MHFLELAILNIFCNKRSWSYEKIIAYRKSVVRDKKTYRYKDESVILQTLLPVVGLVVTACTQM